MRTHFAEVLARESTSLAGVTDETKLAGWRRRLVGELMTPRSPYALALREVGKCPSEPTSSAGGAGSSRTQWIACCRTATLPTRTALQRRRKGDVDPQKTAVLILAALHGGSTLSRVAQDPDPSTPRSTSRSLLLRHSRTPSAAKWGTKSPISNMSP